MTGNIVFRSNKASEAQIAGHLSSCDANFVSRLNDRVEIAEYAKKIAGKAIRFEAWSGNELVGMVAAYCNDLDQRIAYITSVSVLREWTGKGIAASLMRQFIEHARTSGMRQIRLEVASANAPAIGLYKKFGFVAGKADEPFVTMELHLEQKQGK